MITRRSALMAAVATSALVAGPALAEDPIKIGNVMPYSGPASAYGTIGKTINAYIEMTNAKGGVNGRQIEFISYDDGYSPPKMVEQVRRLVEQDEVTALFQTLGTPTNTAIHKYINAKRVPHLFLATGAAKWDDPENFPMTMGWQPSYVVEAKIYAKYIMDNMPDAKVAMLYQNDDFGKDYYNGFKEGLGDKVDMLVAEAPYEVAAPTVDSEVINLKASGADVFIIIATPKFAAQAIKKSAEIGWEAQRFLTNVSLSVGGVLKPAGFEASKGIISAGYLMEEGDAQFADSPELLEWREFMAEWYPEGDVTSSFTVFGYSVGATIVHTLEMAGDDLSREGILAAAASLKDYDAPLLLPGILINTAEDDFAPIEAMQLQKFDGESWKRFGEVITVD
ncbi:amino acid/amide ABC transporter substrate-binding protein, HAAT family [Albimonas donghaensis]|uniref:Amino acid/amide ABC transporter substrate-binding protein, HAAT family n=1 Tax=Albimonas donghaensis TaxID=356660 RepID=A0A1H2TZL7_9RHOB|nr:ABC transporter substrate-binding protein [Albimonas donghaensis]SDW49211.1 amino acid/amide ABC transporter substrate-binding protein, HAAT family [Albimonas donghaensis]